MPSHKATPVTVCVDVTTLPLSLCRRRLVEVGGRQSSVRVQELEQLQAVAVAQHLAVNPFAKAARSSRSNLPLCTYSFELLMHHLQVRPCDWCVANLEPGTSLPAGRVIAKLCC